MSKKKSSTQKEPEYVELDEMNVIMKVPKAAVHITMNVKYFDEHGKMVEVQAYVDHDMIAQARKDFLDNVEFGDGYDAVYSLTDRGREWLAQIEAGNPEAIRELEELAALLEDDKA